MGIFSTLFKSPKGTPYSYKEGRACYGIGVDNMALVRPHGPVPGGTYSPAYNVRRSVNLLSPAFVLESPSYPYVDLRGNGVYLSGDIVLGSLSDPESGNNGKV